MDKISIENGRRHFWQWDLGQRLRIETGGKACQVHYARDGEEKSLVVEPVPEGDAWLADVPNMYLREARPIEVYVYVYEAEKYTVCNATFQVCERAKPDDYVYTETEVRTWDALASQISVAVEGAADATAAANTAAARAERAAENETVREAAETARIAAEKSRAAAEETRAAAEAERAEAELVRIGRENDRMTVEHDRAAAETARADAEAVRRTAEHNRAAAWAAGLGIREITIEDTDTGKLYLYQLKIEGGKPVLWFDEVTE